MKYYYLLALFIPILASSAHILLKTFSIKKHKKYFINNLLDIHLTTGLGLFAMSSVLTIIAMKKIEFSAFYSFTALNYFYISLLSKWFLKEKIDKNKKIGIFIIIAGVIVYNM